MGAINYLTRVEFGGGLAAHQPDFLRELGVMCPLIATDKGLVAAGIVGRLAGGQANAVTDGGTLARSTVQ